MINPSTDSRLANSFLSARFLIPYTRSDLAAAMHSEGKVLSTEYVEEGTLIEAVLPVAFYNKFSRFLAEK